MLRDWIVLYRPPESKPLDQPLCFKCKAESTDHAEEQVLNFEPNSEIVWTTMTSFPLAAYSDWYRKGE